MPPPTRAEHRLRIAGLVCGLVLWVTFAFIGSPASGHRAQDFPQFYALGRLVVERRAADLQDGEALSRVVREQVSPAIHWTLLPIYGPQVALALAPLAVASYRVAEVSWLLISILLYGLAARRLMREATRLHRHQATTWLLAAASPGLFQLVWYGQLSMVALTCTVLGCSLWGRGRRFAAGLAFGLLVYKPQYGIALAVIAASTRAWPVIAGAATSAVAELGLAWAYAGTAIMQQYAVTLFNAPLQLGVLQSNRHLMQSLLTTAQMAPGPVAPIALHAAAAVAVLTGAVHTWRRTTDTRLRFSALVLSGLLVSPHVYVYDLVLLTPVLAWLTDWWLDRTPAAPGAALPAGLYRVLPWLLGALYLWPVVGLILTYYTGVNAGPLAMLATLVVAHRAAVRSTT